MNNQDSCLSTCKEYIIYCYDNCKENECERCNDIVNSCVSGCLELPSERLLRMQNCVDANGCDISDKNCVQKVRNDIVKCYETKCDPLKTDCKKESAYFYDRLFQGDNELIKIKNLYSYKSVEKNKENKENKRILIITIIIIFTIFLFFLKL